MELEQSEEISAAFFAPFRSLRETEGQRIFTQRQQSFFSGIKKQRISNSFHAVCAMERRTERGNIRSVLCSFAFFA